MYRNLAQKWVVFAFEDEGGTNPGDPVTGDAANITANVRIDGGAANAVDDTNPTELEDGYYIFDITAAECDGAHILIAPASSTANVLVIGVPGAVWTRSGPLILDQGTAQAGAATTITLRAGASATDDLYEGGVVHIKAGTGAGQSRAVDSYVGSTKIATIIGTWNTNPDSTSVYEIYPDAITGITDPPSAAELADAVWDEDTSGHTTGGTFGEQCKVDIDAILEDTDTTLDALIDAIKAKTDQLNFGATNAVDANITNVAGGSDITASGTGGQEYGES